MGHGSAEDADWSTAECAVSGTALAANSVDRPPIEEPAACALPLTLRVKTSGADASGSNCVAFCSAKERPFSEKKATIAEADINARVYKLFKLTPTEIALLEREVEH